MFAVQYRQWQPLKVTNQDLDLEYTKDRFRVHSGERHGVWESINLFRDLMEALSFIQQQTTERDNCYCSNAIYMDSGGCVECEEERNDEER